MSMLGMNDPNSRPAMLARHMIPGMIPGPVPPAPPMAPGFRPPGGGGAPGVPQRPQQQGGGGGGGMNPMAMMALMGMMGGKGANEAQVNQTLGAAPGATQGMDANAQPYTISGGSDPMAQGGAQAADMMGSGSFMGWLKGLF